MESIRNKVPSLEPDGTETWGDKRHFPVWVFFYDAAGNEDQVSIRHVVVDAAFPCLRP